MLRHGEVFYLEHLTSTLAMLIVIMSHESSSTRIAMLGGGYMRCPTLVRSKFDPLETGRLRPSNKCRG